MSERKCVLPRSCTLATAAALSAFMLTAAVAASQERIIVAEGVACPEDPAEFELRACLSVFPGPVGILLGLADNASFTDSRTIISNEIAGRHFNDKEINFAVVMSDSNPDTKWTAECFSGIDFKGERKIIAQEDETIQLYPDNHNQGDGTLSCRVIDTAPTKVPTVVPTATVRPSPTATRLPQDEPTEQVRARIVLPVAYTQ